MSEPVKIEKKKKEKKLDLLIWEAASPRTHKPKIVNESLQIPSLTASILCLIVFSSDKRLGLPISTSVQRFFSGISMAGSCTSPGLACFLPGFFFPFINFLGLVMSESCP